MTRASVIADSTNVLGNRLVTVDLVYPAIVHHYLMSYTSFARSTNDFRCLTPGSLLQQVRDEGYHPETWRRAAAKGPVPRGKLNAGPSEEADAIWRKLMLDSMEAARKLGDLHVAREITNRILEPFAWMRAVVTADYEMWCNFLQHRTSMSEQTEIRSLAYKVADAIRNSATTELAKGDWHVPLAAIGGDYSARVKSSVARCARIAYRTPRPGGWSEIEDFESDVSLHDKLARAADWSHFEHQALCWIPSAYRNDDDEAVPFRIRGKFADGWVQYRKTVSGEVFTRYKGSERGKRQEAERKETGGVTWGNFALELSRCLEKIFGTRSK